ncbi:tRNA pseudouridine synthase B [Pullulanibacillus pueri]|uniref:tRNA pseudouridine synthase B n=1 Tax=Pullulanibacillus pueri TaxID=1437324 RepID=A0A8J3EMT9_9BACL|nr:tRNA pseudouridine synthase B [Pullulanibacillus pueri]
MPLYKPKGMTSHDCIYRLRKLLKMKKIGHTGTLDPDVDGVLPICLGQATKIAQYITADSKTYRGIISLGKTTTTEDASGESIEEKPVTDSWSRSELERVFKSFEGAITQVPPMYSAVKVKGKKLYEYAREGIIVERPIRMITIHRLSVDSEEKRFSTMIPFVVDCSKGTYVRTLAVDIGHKLGYPAHLSQLTRLRSGAFQLEECVTFSDIEVAIENGNVDQFIKPINVALSGMPKWIVDDETASRIQNGSVLVKPDDFKNEPHTVYNRQGECIAIYKVHPQKPQYIKPEKVFSN